MGDNRINDYIEDIYDLATNSIESDDSYCDCEVDSEYFKKELRKILEDLINEISE